VKALKDLEANGTYAKILAKWGLTSLADKTPGVNTGIQATLYG
jgi:ABC-type amino acid transport substrate-binding protein